jgi:hypothetical protein
MAFVGAVMLGERLTLPGRPRWHLPAFLHLLDLRLISGARQDATSHG